MSGEHVGSIKIQILESITGKFRANVMVETDGWGVWRGQAWGADTQLEAVEDAVEKIRAATSPHKRGRRPKGYRSVISLSRRMARRESV